MNDREPVTTTNLDIYGGETIAWSRARDLLESDTPKAETACFLGTVRPDGRPHAAGIGPAWVDGDLYFTSGPGTRKSRDLAGNPNCTISMRLHGMDLVLEGEAARVTDPERLERVAGRYREGGWPARVEGDALTAPYSAQSAGPPPWHVYRLRLRTAIGLTTEEPHGATSWRFVRGG